MPKKIRVEADRCAPKPTLAPGMTRTAGHGQKVSLERGSWTRSKKNPGKRPSKGGLSPRGCGPGAALCLQRSALWQAVFFG